MIYDFPPDQSNIRTAMYPMDQKNLTKYFSPEDIMKMIQGRWGDIKNIEYLRFVQGPASVQNLDRLLDVNRVNKDSVVFVMNKNNQNYLVDKRGNEVVQKMYNILQYPMPQDRLTAQSQEQTKPTDVIVNIKDFPNFKIIKSDTSKNQRWSIPTDKKLWVALNSNGTCVVNGNLEGKYTVQVNSQQIPTIIVDVNNDGQKDSKIKTRMMQTYVVMQDGKRIQYLVPLIGTPKGELMIDSQMKNWFQRDV